MHKILFLDDDPERHRLFRARAKKLCQLFRRPDIEVVQTDNPETAIAIIQKEGPSLKAVYLDRDLGLPTSGEDVAYAMTMLPLERRPAKVVVHSLNPFRAPVMVEMLEDAGYEVHRVPFEY